MDANSSELELLTNIEYLNSVGLNSNSKSTKIIQNDQDESSISLPNLEIDKNQPNDNDTKFENSESESVSDEESDSDSKDDLDSNLDENQSNESNHKNDNKSQRKSKLEEQEKHQDLLQNSSELSKVCLRTKSNSKRSNELDSVRFSMYNIQNSQVNEIDALLSELNQLQTNLIVQDKQSEHFATSNMQNLINSNSYIKSYKTDQNIEAIDQQFDEVLKFLAQTIEENNTPDLSSSSPSSMSLSATPNYDEPKNDRNSNETHQILNEFINSRNQINNQTNRTSSNSEFVEVASMPSSVSLGVINANNRYAKHNQKESSSSSCSSAVLSENSPNNQLQHDTGNPAIAANELGSKTLSPEQHKAELIRIALEKLKEANIKKLIVKAYTDDGCAKSVIIDETMRIYDVMLMLFSKNHVRPTVNYCIVEYLPKFNMERIFEDHENLVEAMSNWSRDSENQILFTEKSDKYDLFLKPELYLTNEKNFKNIDDSERTKLVDEFFQNIGSPVPEIEGPLYLKVESKKSWKKYYCVLRQSGLYYIPKGKAKKDMQCLFNFEKLDLYYGFDWRKEFKAPTDSCFALKYPQVQKKSSKYIKYICCENQRDLKRWYNGIRIAKFGKQLFDNYKNIAELIELSKVSGRVPYVNNRRLSSSMSNTQRPRSSYSLMTNLNSNDDQNQMCESQMKNSFTTFDSDLSSSQNNNNNQINSASSYAISNNHNLSASTSLLIRKDSSLTIKSENEAKDLSLMKTSLVNGSQVSIQSYKSNNYQIKQPSMAYTDQLKSLIQANQLKNQSEDNLDSSVTQNSNKSWQNMLAPISVKTNIVSTNSNNKSAGNLTKSPNNKTVRIPVTTDLTKQLMNSSTLKSASENKNATVSNLDLSFRRERPQLPQRNFESEEQISITTSDSNKMSISSASFNLNYATNQNIYDLPSPSVELLQPQFEHTSTSSSMSRNTKGQAPPIGPKPVISRQNSCAETEQFLITNQYSNEILRKKSFESTNSNGNDSNRSSNGSQSRNSNNNQNNPHLINELSNILARQKKKLEECQTNDSACIESRTTVNVVKQPSPTITKKPPPPPRNERTHLARKLSDNARQMMN